MSDWSEITDSAHCSPRALSFVEKAERDHVPDCDMFEAGDCTCGADAANAERERLKAEIEGAIK